MCVFLKIYLKSRGLNESIDKKKTFQDSNGIKDSVLYNENQFIETDSDTISESDPEDQIDANEGFQDLGSLYRKSIKEAFLNKETWRRSILC